MERDGEEGDDSGGDYTITEILAAVRRVCLARSAVPVLCGASLRGIGVEPLLDAISTFLPSPLDRPRPSGVIPQVSIGRGRGGKKGARKAGGGDSAGALAAVAGNENVVDVDPLQEDLVALVFKVIRCRYERPTTDNSAEFTAAKWNWLSVLAHTLTRNPLPRSGFCCYTYRNICSFN